MWRSVFHDQENDRMFIWYVDGTMDALPVDYEFYTPKQGEFGAVPCGMKNIWGQDMYRATVLPANGMSAYKVETELKRSSAGSTNHLAEIDIDPRCRFLQKLYSDAGMLHPDMSQINLGFLDIENATTGPFSLPTEAAYAVNVATLYVSKTDSYYVYGLRDIKQENKDILAQYNGKYIWCKDEADLLVQLMSQIGASDLDILSGWNFGFDTTYIATRIKKLNENLRGNNKINMDIMSRMRGKNKRAYMTKDNELVINGTEVIDFLALYKKYTFSEEPSYKLDYIGGKICGEHKAPLPDGYQSWIRYWDDYVMYNFQDVRLLKYLYWSVCRFY